MDFGDCVLVAYKNSGLFDESGAYRLVNRSTIPQLDMTVPALKLIKFDERNYTNVIFRLQSSVPNVWYYVSYAIKFNGRMGRIEVLLTSWMNEHKHEIPPDMPDKIVSSLFLDKYPVIKPMLMQKCVETWIDHSIVKYDDFMNNYNNRVINNAAKTIQNKWQEARLNPYCRLGYNTINRQYDDYFGKP